MGLFKEIAILFRKDLILELRMKYAISGILLYVFSTIFIVYNAFIEVDAKAWNTIFWIIILFASVNAILKSFVQENSARQLYYYTLVSPIAIIISKVLYNIFLLLILSILTWLVFSFVTDNPVRDNWQFFLALLLGSIGFSTTFTFISAISAKADNSATLMAILSFPLIIPILLTLIKLSGNSMRPFPDPNIQNDIVILIAIDLLLFAMSLILYPFLWKD